MAPMVLDLINYLKERYGKFMTPSAISSELHIGRETVRRLMDGCRMVRLTPTRARYYTIDVAKRLYEKEVRWYGKDAGYPAAEW